jgi:hypothetical protein
VTHSIVARVAKKTATGSEDPGKYLKIYFPFGHSICEKVSNN